MMMLQTVQGELGGGERRDVTDSARDISVGGKRRDFTVSTKESGLSGEM